MAASVYDVQRAEFVAAANDPASLPPPALAEIAFAGRSNVGKSSLMNVLLQRHSLVRTSSTPGCTRSVNIFRATVRGDERGQLDLHLVDLPGYGFARRSKAERVTWGPMLEGFLLERPTLRAVIVIVDARRGVEDDDLQLVEFCARPRPGGAPLVTPIVATKLDLVPKSKRKPVLATLARQAFLPIGEVLGFAAKGPIAESGREAVWRAIDHVVRGVPTR